MSLGTVYKKGFSAPLKVITIFIISLKKSSVNRKFANHPCFI